ncbi:MAG: rhamnulokinase family protein [Chloroflexota bacterium]
MAQKTVLAIDLGAESGRVMAVGFDGQRLSLEQLHRFANPLTTINGTIHWDFLHLWREITAGIAKGKALQPVSLGVDTWGVDFGLLDKQGKLIGNPVNYRDPRAEGMMEAVFAKVPKAEVFAQTGSQFLSLNTLYQMMSLVESGSPQLEIANTFLMAPDLLNYWLTGAKVCEFSNATTTQMLNPTTGTWAFDLLARLGIPKHIFPEIVPSGTKLGTYDGIPVIAPACHDTGSAVATVPAATNDFAYISSGTWSLVGLENDKAILSEAALAANAANEGGVYGTWRFLKNIMGLWILQQCRATWAANGELHEYAELVAMAETATSSGLFDPDDQRFLRPGDHPALIQSIFQEKGLPAPQSKGEIVRCVLESLAQVYADVVRQLADLSDKQVGVLHIVGGGSQNGLLNQLTANALGVPVVTGPIEATVIGNALVQLITLGEISDLNEGRTLVADSFPQTHYEPQH